MNYQELWRLITQGHTTEPPATPPPETVPRADAIRATHEELKRNPGVLYDTEDEPFPETTYRDDETARRCRALFDLHQPR